MDGFDLIAERRIAEAVARGEFDDLPGAGAPLELDDDLLVPQELRMTLRILRNAGYVPAEVGALAEIASLERLLATDDDQSRRRAAVARLDLLRARLDASRAGRGSGLAAPYLDRVLGRLARR